MRTSNLGVSLLAVVLVLGGCVVRGDKGDDENRDASLTPQFEPAEDGASGGTALPTTPPASPTEGSANGASSTTSLGPVPDVRLEASITDNAGDVTPSPLDQAPAWADLLGARLVRSKTGFELRIRLGGGDAPEAAPDDDHTMNLASFYDVDGDGTIDYEVWANVASGGWGTSYFDNSEEGGRFGEESFVEVTTDGDEVVLRFALLHLNRAERFRWSIASEWGRYDVLGTQSMARDDAPDDNAAASFPGA